MCYKILSYLTYPATFFSNGRSSKLMLSELNLCFTFYFLLLFLLRYYFSYYENTYLEEKQKNHLRKKSFANSRSLYCAKLSKSRNSMQAAILNDKVKKYDKFTHSIRTVYFMFWKKVLGKRLCKHDLYNNATDLVFPPFWTFVLANLTLFFKDFAGGRGLRGLGGRRMLVFYC